MSLLDMLRPRKKKGIVTRRDLQFWIKYGEPEKDWSDRKTWMKIFMQAIWHFEFEVNGEIVRYLDSRIPYIPPKMTKAQKRAMFNDVRRAFEPLSIPHRNAVAGHMVRIGKWELEWPDESLVKVRHTREDMPLAELAR